MGHRRPNPKRRTRVGCRGIEGDVRPKTPVCRLVCAVQSTRKGRWHHGHGTLVLTHYRRLRSLPLRLRTMISLKDPCETGNSVPPRRRPRPRVRFSSSYTWGPTGTFAEDMSGPDTPDPFSLP